MRDQRRLGFQPIAQPPSRENLDDPSTPWRVQYLAHRVLHCVPDQDLRDIDGNLNNELNAEVTKQTVEVCPSDLRSAMVSVTNGCQLRFPQTRSHFVTSAG